jgi:LmeA-like phospholipid-binding
VSNGRRGGCLRTFVIAIIVLVIVLVALDFGAKAFAQDKLASEIKSHGFPKKPSVSIEGFPFLTQVIGRDIHQVKISSQNVPEGPVRISKISAVMSGIHLNSGYTSGTISRVSGSVLISFSSLSSTLSSRAGPFGSLLGSAGLKLSSAGPDKVRASLNLPLVSGSATWRITRSSGRRLTGTLVSSSGVPSELLGGLGHFSVQIPELPFHVQIGSVRITPDGVVGQLSGRDLTFSGGSS